METGGTPRPDAASWAGPPAAGYGGAGYGGAGPAVHQPPAPSGLFPGRPPRPTYREPHPVRGHGVLAGFGTGLLWIFLFGLLGEGLGGSLAWTVGAGAAAWAVALVLARYGDRGTAVGVSLAAGAGWTAAGGLTALYWSGTGGFPWW